MKHDLSAFDGQDAMTEDALATRVIRPLLVEETGECDCSEEGITARASTITVVLEDILSNSPAFPHGGINECRPSLQCLAAT